MPTFPEAIEIVTSGGTSMVGGFVEIFQDEFEKVKFPVDVKNIRRSEDPLSAVAKGALVASLTE
jgi:actin-related protein